MDAVKFLRTKGKMTKNCGIICAGCPFYQGNNGTNINCNKFILEYPEKAVKIAEEWINRYEISYKDDFLKKHPNAPKDENGDPITCRKYIYGGEKCPEHDDCHKCWNEIKDDE